MKTQVMRKNLMSKDQIQIYYFREIFAFEIDTKCKGGRLAGQNFGVRGVLEVQPNELVLATNDAQFDRGFERRVAPKMGLDTGVGH